ncbi:hypothetical protein J6590_010080 [Homalodisca vitripennis]|nr:hypothetical protein J6590_010080 [Homalodisca vitripennis]
MFNYAAATVTCQKIGARMQPELDHRFVTYSKKKGAKGATLLGKKFAQNSIGVSASNILGLPLLGSNRSLARPFAQELSAVLGKRAMLSRESDPRPAKVSDFLSNLGEPGLNPSQSSLFLLVNIKPNCVGPRLK